MKEDRILCIWNSLDRLKTEFLPFYGTGAAAGGKGKKVLRVDKSAQAGGKGKQVPEPQAAAAAVITIIEAKIQVISSRFSL